MKPLLIIDPGHGGKDPGGGTNNIWKEKDLALVISLYQYNRYKELGIPVSLTRKTDVTLTPNDRTAIVRNSGARYCHSNHINAGGGDGAEIIHSLYGGKEMSAVIAGEIKNVGQNIRRIYTRALPTNPKQDYYFMNRNTGKVTTAIIEYGFADSKGDDVQQLQVSWKLYAEAVVKGFCQFIGSDYVESGANNRTVIKGEGLKLFLPATINRWRIYPMNKRPIIGNEVGYLNPAKYNGLDYMILGNPFPHVYTIETRDFGMVNIYAHTKTGAILRKMM